MSHRLIVLAKCTVIVIIIAISLAPTMLLERVNILKKV